MLKDEAVKLMECMERFRGAFNDATEITITMRDADEGKRVRAILGAMVAQSLDLVTMIERQYPEVRAD